MVLNYFDAQIFPNLNIEIPSNWLLQDNLFNETVQLLNLSLHIYVIMTMA